MTDSIDTILDESARLIRLGLYDQAAVRLRPCIEVEQPSWNALYLLGQCHRFLNQFDEAIRLLDLAAQTAPAQAPVFLALGISFQLNGQLDQSQRVFLKAIEIDPDYALAYNSLALTQKIAGEFEKALHNYDSGCKALARRIVKSLVNHRSSRIFKHRDTVGSLWLEQALYGALYLATERDGLHKIAIPSGDTASAEEATEKNGGLYWQDSINADSERVRFFLPNYFNTVREAFKSEPTYANLLGNRGTVLELVGRGDEARAHADEATSFLPAAG